MHDARFLTRDAINSTSGLTSRAAAIIQAHIVLRATCTCCRAKMFSSRYSGK